MTKLVLAALVLTTACHKHSDSAKDKPAVTLPVPTKLPPVQPGSGAAKPADDHAASIDSEYATLIAMYKAPPGATPCESLYNAIGAEQDAAKSMKRDSVFTFVAPKADFLKQCGALPAMTQQCLVPAYQSTHGAECESLHPDEKELDKLYKLRDGLEPPKEKGQGSAQ
ncbi:MAG: hypothetical protein JO257_34930 [Deltaproteobacteria bacterium]|nr:hypothetical protein [Deltaproteobacteria bacterium]